MEPTISKALWAACEYLNRDHAGHAKGRCPWKIDPGKLEAALESAGLMALPMDQIHMEERGMCEPAGMPPADPIEPRPSWGADLPEEFKARPFGKAMDGLWWAIEALKGKCEAAESNGEDGSDWLWELTAAELADALEEARLIRWEGGMDGHWEVMDEPTAQPCDVECLGGSFPSDNKEAMRFMAKFSESGWKQGKAVVSYEVSPDKKVYRIGIEFRPDEG